MQSCENCAQPLRDGARFCRACGAPVAAAEISKPTLRSDDQDPVNRTSDEHVGPEPRSRAPLLAALTALVLLLGGGGVAAWLTLGHAPSRSASEGPSASVLTTTPVTGAPSTSSSPPTAPKTTSGATTGPPDPMKVQLSEGSASVATSTVLPLLQRYFDATNAHDYTAWATSVTPQRAAQQSPTAWVQGYESTQDSSVVITGITSTGPDSATAALSFVSTQNPADAPSDLPLARICWHTQLPVSNLSSGGRIGPAPPGTTTKSAC